MKKVLLIMLSILLPLGVSAMDYSSEFDIGDSVSVSFNGKTDSKNLIGFHVLNGSSSGETTVTLVYDGVLATHDASGNIKEAQIAFQTPDTSATTNASQFAGSNAKRFLDEAVKEQGWILASSARLLEESDLTILGITKDADGTFTIPTKYDFLRPVDFDSAINSSTTDYWTQIADGANNVYVVTKEGTDKANNISAKIVSKIADPVSGSSTYSIKPVIVVDKQYIACNNTKTPNNVPTGVEDYYYILGGTLLLASIGYVVSKKKNAFQNI